MIKICKICGKQFGGRANATVCSGACRLEAKKRYQAEYKKRYPKKIKETQKKYWDKRRALENAFNLSQSDNLKLTFAAAANEIPKEKPEAKRKRRKKYKGSEWALKYSDVDRLTQISMLSGELSHYEIEHLSYGALSLIYDSGQYEELLQKVLEIKQQEEAK